MPTERTITEYRVVSIREGRTESGESYEQRTEKRFRSRKAAADRVGLLTSPEPWRFFGSVADRTRSGDAYVCCAGTGYDGCGCGGLTLAEQTKEKRDGLPPLKSVTIQKRTVTTTAWEEAGEVAHAD